MPPKTKRQKQLDKVRPQGSKKKDVSVQPMNETPKSEGFLKKADPKIMAFQAIYTGTGYKEQASTMLMQGIDVPVESTFYKAQQGVAKDIVTDTKEQCKIEASKIKNGANLSEDGTWNHMKNGSAATVTVIDVDRQKVVAYHVVQKSVGSFVGNFEGPSNMMESEGVRRVLDQLDEFIRDKIINFIHDNDNKTSRIIADTTFMINDLFDPGHSVQSIERSAKTYFDKCADVLYREKNKQILESQSNEQKLVECMPKRGRMKGAITKTSLQKPYTALIPKLKAWFNYLVHNVKERDKRKAMWLNTVNHLLGDHSHCIHPSDYARSHPGRPRKNPNDEKEMWVWKEGQEDKILEAQLAFFIGKTAERLDKISDTSTQSNESLNASISRHCPKNKVFTASVEARVSIAIAKKNDPHFPTKFITKHFPNSVPQKAIDKLWKMENERLEDRILKADPREHMKKNFGRMIQRQTNKCPLGDYKSDNIFQ